MYNTCTACNIVRHTQVHTDSAQRVLGLSVELSGALGKRTRYQEKELAQLLLTVSTPTTDREDLTPTGTPLS